MTSAHTYRLTVSVFASAADRHMNGGQCRYSSTPDHNLCTHAHSQEELDEWRERWHWRQMKRDIARKEQVFSYMEQLLEDYDHAESPIAVVSRPW